MRDMSSGTWEQRRRRVEERQRAPVVSPCDQCRGVGAECRALSLFSTCGRCTVKGVRCSHNASGGRGSDVIRDWGVSSPISSASETNMSTAFEGVQQAIIAYLMEEEVLEVQRQEMRGGFGRSCWWHWVCRARGSVMTGRTRPRSRTRVMVRFSVLLLI
ncbi:hypothetical protein CNAG_07950 [Cryptococcus neoformans var. grubii H99]|uniref:Zn(2)-C6 fungal-type domain-containing protein n=1 Tax=Cryptococcus neoformans (strain H99 / ATCC 208821 / CBS 10515 / FGSC 9487) TaxID=235443 RepID=T2BQB5_CRYN9|nr:hypothetical protein CNAG_07950 [Cryptococcus neoformans var. grubii H99]AGV15302.1 hypothetical protein CNAG_07950 [Cryptococcus neoformans var. grubii H99]AUB21954.1 hypothetical protein CKF44_07950 [Cryptococcus neoformans var. grubii]|eukprot:XP_012047081.1 hypothetical protein CNAG_07950 [Cryptococcus neoformans var. grubii H99]